VSLHKVRLYIHHFRSRWIEPVFQVRRLRSSASLYGRYFSDWSRYATTPGSETLRFLDSYPCLFDRAATTSFDGHYFYQDIWALKAILGSGTPLHVDVGSNIVFVGMLTAFTHVIFLDIRPLAVNLERFASLSGNILTMPLLDNSVTSLSCLHVAEHIGLGRYGDSLDPQGTRKAARELARVLAPQGHLYFSVPVGKPRLCFNAHRVHSPQQILDYFHDLELVEFSGIDRGTFRQSMDPADLAEANYACGLFHFTKKL
jgi:SAM-dependent methyltransferase